MKRLAFLLAGILAVGAVLAYWKYDRVRSPGRMALSEQLGSSLYKELHGGLKVEQDLSRPDQPVVYVKVTPRLIPHTTEWLAGPGGAEVEELVVGRYPDDVLTDGALVHLPRLPKLRTVRLRGAAITDAGLEHLKGLTGLELLDLSDTKITDAGLGTLRSLSRLKTLNLANTQVTDAGLEHVREWADLETLILTRTGVTDVTLRRLQESSSLLRLDLDQTRITRGAVETFRQAMPRVVVYY
jgi:hypothetical protein